MLKLKFNLKIEMIKSMQQIKMEYWLKGILSKSKRKAMNRNWCNQKANPALKTKFSGFSKALVMSFV